MFSLEVLFYATMKQIENLRKSCETICVYPLNLNQYMFITNIYEWG